jgi:transcriptional regulator with XRE-family HTH domain
LKKKALQKEIARNAWPWRGSVVKARRLKLRLTQQELSDGSTVSVSCISAYENERVTPRKENQYLILDALGGTWPEMYDDSSAPGATPSGPAEAPGREAPDGREGCVLCGELERVAASSDATVVVTCTLESGGLEAFAWGRDNRLLVIRPYVTLATLADVMRLRAIVDRLEERVRRQPP